MNRTGMHVTLAGATGLVGKALLKLMISDDRVERVTVLTRRHLNINEAKIREVITDFETLDERQIPLQQDAVFCCLGTTMARAGSKDAFRKVDYEYVVKLAVFSQRAQAKQFHVVSASNASAKSRIFYAQVKGRMEGEVRKLTKIRSMYIYRPSMLLGPRSESRPTEAVGKWMMQVLRLILPASMKAVQATDVAMVMWENAVKPLDGTHIITNARFLR